MILCGLDIATTTGIAIMRGNVASDIHAWSFRPRAKRPEDLKKGAVDFTHESLIAMEFRDHLYGIFIAEGVECVGIEKPLPPNLQEFGGPTMTGIQKRGAVSFGTIFRIYMLVGQAIEVCARLSIPIHVVHQASWRKSFIGVSRAPKGNTDNKWLKKEAMKRCDLLRIPATNLDAAEAVGIVWHLRGVIQRPSLIGPA